MKRLNDSEVQCLYSLLFYGDTFTTSDYYAEKDAPRKHQVMLYDKGAIEWGDRATQKLRITHAGKAFLKQHSEKG